MILECTKHLNIMLVQHLPKKRNATVYFTLANT